MTVSDRPLVASNAGSPAEAPADARTGVRGGGYRPHLDGIRAFAVVIVVAFHLGYEWIPGGFIGVDVFFVLSGYLITGILADEVGTHGKVRLRRFYSRRVRRLLPASIAVIGTVLVAGHFWLDAIQFHDLGVDALWSSLYSANWRFVTKGGDYFAVGDVPSPLVHYWSLAVEEQFYFVWPVLVAATSWVMRRTGRSVIGGLTLAVLGLGLASVVISITTVGSTSAYYGTHSRAYQLLAGAALACLVRRHPALDRTQRDTSFGRLRSVAPLAALAAVGALVWLAHSTEGASRYPGWAGVAVTVASLVLIASLDLTPEGVHQRVFGSWPMAALGRWSYSVYIWHWPVIVFAPVVAQRWSHEWVDDPSAMVAVIAVLAGASYLIIERPVRFRLLPAARPLSVVAVGLSCSVLMAVVADVSSRVEPHQKAAFAASKDLAQPGKCPYDAVSWEATGPTPCVWREGDGPTIALVGDSHAHQWQPAIDVLAARNDARVVRVTRVGCPVNDVTVFGQRETGRDETDEACTRWRRAVLPRLVQDEDPDIIFVATRGYVTGIDVDGRWVSPRDPEHLELWSEGWDWTLDVLTSGGADVVVSTIIPTIPERLPACLMRNAAGTDLCDFPLSTDVRRPPYNDVIRSLPITHEGVTVVDLVPLVCPDDMCPAIIDGMVVHRDNNHVTARFARRHADDVADLVAAAGVDLTAPA